MTAVPVVPHTLYHYTCLDHGAPGIQRAGKLRPWPQPLFRRSVVWMTDLDIPDAWALGLTRHTLCCDRTQVRVTVHPHGDGAGNPPAFVAPWWYYARKVPYAVRDILEDVGLPMHWWVSEKSVPATGMTTTAALYEQIARNREAARHA